MPWYEEFCQKEKRKREFWDKVKLPNLIPILRNAKGWVQKIKTQVIGRAKFEKVPLEVKIPTHIASSFLKNRKRGGREITCNISRKGERDGGR